MRDDASFSSFSREMSSLRFISDVICADFAVSDDIISVLSGVAHSAPADGVGARISATKSHIVKSVSCPTADITGTGDERTFLASVSSLKAQRSSIEPPPLPIIMTSAGEFFPKY